MENSSGTIVETTEKISRLRLVLPDLSKSFIGNWLASVEKSLPPDLLYDDDDLFNPSIRNDGVNVPKRSDVESGLIGASRAHEDDANLDYNLQNKAGAINGHDLWLRAGGMPPRGPVLQTWEHCHGLENWLRKSVSEEFRERNPPRSQIGAGAFHSVSDDRQLIAVDTSPEPAPPAQYSSIPENTLVRDALYALQGLPAAVRKIEELSKIYSATPADKNAHRRCTLWTRTVTAPSLGKVLSVVARAGHVRCQLNAFVSFFLDDPPESFEEKRKLALRFNKAASKKKKKGKLESQQIQASDEQANDAKGTEDGTRKLPHQCLVNQAFAAAVKGILRGHSAALNTLASSISLRRAQENISISRKDLIEDDPGPVIGYRSLDISLLEFFLHTRELRVQLHSLAFICLRREGKSFVGRDVSDPLPQEIIVARGKGKKKGSEKGGKPLTKINWSDPLVRSFDDFPRGADLLTYLYDQLTGMDPLHLELLRFLFERTYEPYSIFIQSWLYQAAVRDPYGEFIIEQADFSAVSPSSMVKGNLQSDPRPTNLKLRSGLHVPRFMESICTPLIRAGEQLQVLLKLSQTSELAQQMAKKMRTWDMFIPQPSTQSLTQSSKSSPVLPALVFSKRKLEEAANQREKQSELLSEQFDLLFAKLSSRRNKKETSAASSDSAMVNGMEYNECLAGHREPGEQIDPEPPLDTRLQQELTKYESSEVRVTLPKRGWVTSAEDEPGAENILVSSKVKFSSDVHRGSRSGPADSVANVDMDATGKEVAPSVPGHVFGLYMPYRDPFDVWSHPDTSGVSRLGEKVQLSLISGHQRGTSWPLYGLPMNPFLAQEDKEDSAPNTYGHPSFLGTYRHWDVTTKSTTSVCSDNKSSLADFREPLGLWRENNIEPPWFTRLESALNDQLYSGLDAQLDLPCWPQANGAHIGIHSGQENLSNHFEQLSGHFNQPFPELSPSVASDSKFPLTASPERPNGQIIGSPAGFGEPEFSDELALRSGRANSLDLCSDSQSKRDGVADVTSRQGLLEESQLSSASSTEAKPVTASGSSSPSTGDIILGNNSFRKCEAEQYASNREAPKPRLAAIIVANKGGRALETVIDPLAPKSGENISGDSGIGGDAGEYGIRDVAHKWKVHDSSEREKLSPLKSERFLGAANWEQYLKSYYSVSPEAVLDGDGDGIDEGEDCADEEIPLSVVVSKCIVEEILSQYKAVSTMTLRLFQEGLCLQDHYNALRRYFFMERGDWAEYFTAALCQHKWGHLGDQHRQMEVQGMLDAAFQKSSCEKDEYAERVYVSLEESVDAYEKSTYGSTKTTLSFVDCSRLDAFDFISLQYRVDWPVSLILTSHSLRLYNIVFTFLIRIKLTVHALQDIWQRLQVIDRSLQKSRNSPTSHQQRNRFRTLQQFRQQIFHFVTTVQQYVESKLLYVVWSKFLRDIQIEVNDMQDLEVVHDAYLEDAMDECFLCAKTTGVKGCIDSIMQCVLDLSSHMKTAVYRRGERLDLIDDGLFMQVHQLKKGFQTSLQQLHGYHLKQDPQGHSNLSDLWMILDYNGFLSTALSTTYS